MNLTEDEPRKIPKPMPFSEQSTLQPAVPEVSLILQNSSISPKKIHSSYTGTDFQTYNAWKWKNVNDREKESLSARSFAQSKKQEFYPINDRFSGSDIEKRKNEILYGSVEEPRRPLPPRSAPVIPNYIGASFSDTSFSNEMWNDKDIQIKNFSSSRAYNNNKNNTENGNPNIRKPSCNCAHEEKKGMNDLYQIIADQSQQMVLLQKQIQQLLKSQENKEKQIEQLLKSQETKEDKIEQLLKMQDSKENQIEQLLRAQEKHETQIQQLIRVQEAKEKQNIQLSNQLKSLEKQTVTVGTMTTICVCDKSTNTNLQWYQENENTEEYNKFGTGDKSLTLQSLELPTMPEHTPTPQSSIHVDIPEYNASSDEESITSSSTSKDIQIHTVLDSKPLGYTFYNNVLTQVNDIIQNNEDKENEEAVKMKVNSANMELQLENKYQKNYLKGNYPKMTTSLDSSDNAKQWGIDVYETVTDFNNVHRPGTLIHNNRANPAFHMRCNAEFGRENPSPSDISLRMNALALKYLKEEQISQYQMQFDSQQNSKQPDVTIYNVTNLSFGTMRYLERYRISPHDDPSNASQHHFLQQKVAMRNCSYKNK